MSRYEPYNYLNNHQRQQAIILKSLNSKINQTPSVPIMEGYPGQTFSSNPFCSCGKMDYNINSNYNYNLDSNVFNSNPDVPNKDPWAGVL